MINSNFNLFRVDDRNSGWAGHLCWPPLYLAIDLQVDKMAMVMMMMMMMRRRRMIVMLMEKQSSRVSTWRLMFDALYLVKMKVGCHCIWWKCICNLLSLSPTEQVLKGSFSCSFIFWVKGTTTYLGQHYAVFCNFHQRDEHFCEQCLFLKSWE